MLNFLEIMKPLYGIKSFSGYTDAEISYLKQLYGTLPKVLEEYYHTAGNTKAFHYAHVQDKWILPKEACYFDNLRSSGYMAILNENQSCCQACIRLKDLEADDPPVYNTHDGQNWLICAPSVSEFLAAALAYEAAFTFEYSPEDFYYLEKEDFEILKQRLKKYPFEIQNWVGDMKISLYSNEPSNLAAIMECDGGDIQMLYGAASEDSYNKLSKALEGIGEPL